MNSQQWSLQKRLKDSSVQDGVLITEALETMQVLLKRICPNQTDLFLESVAVHMVLANTGHLLALAMHGVMATSKLLDLFLPMRESLSQAT